MAYTGAKVKIPLGELGLLTDIGSDKTPPNALIEANNVCFFNGAVEKAPGTYKWNADDQLDAPIVAIRDWAPDVITQRMIAVTANGKVYEGRDRKFGDPIVTGLGDLTPNCVLTEGGQETAGRNKKLFLFTGSIVPQVLRGTSGIMSPISQPNSDWSGVNFPVYGVVHRNRLWAFAGQIAYASDSGDHENFNTNTLVEPIYPGEGGEIRGGFVYKGRLFVFKDGGFVYLLVDQDANDNSWYWEKIASNFGLSAPNAIDEVLDNLFSGNPTGTITDFSATDKLGSVEAGDLIQLTRFENYLRGNTSKTGVTRQHLMYYPEKKILFATYRSRYKNHNDMLIAFDFGLIRQVRPSFWIKGTPQCLGLWRDVNEIRRPMYGSQDGYVHIMDQKDRLEGDTAYEASFQVPNIDFSQQDPQLGVTEKHFDFLAVHYVPSSEGTLKCDYYIDGRFIETIEFPMTQYKAAKLGTLELGTDRMAQPTTETTIRQLRGSGRTFSARFYNSGANESFRVPAITVMFRGGGEKAQQVKAGGK